jgi:hypothetical protein
VNKKFWLLGLVITSLSLFLIIPMIQAKNKNITGLLQQSTYNLSTDSNFFGQAENTTPVEIDAAPEIKLLGLGYQAVSETDELKLYVKERYFQIAVLDKASGYIWYSVYPDYLQLGLSGTSRFFVESGVIIEYYNLDNILVEDSKSYVSGTKYNVEVDYDYESVEQGFKAHLNFKDQAIEFDVMVYIEEGQLKVTLPIDSLVEGDIEKPVLNIDGTTTIKTTSYRLKSVYVFPYFGSNNYEINGYSMIPDGSGALIRYTNVRSSTAYTKRIYGVDEGISAFKAESSTYYLQNELTASYPAFGVNHGYQQAAFLAVMTEGDSFAEIHSYPYGYNAYPLNTTFFKFIVRERYTIQTSSNSSDSFQLINTDPYPTDYVVTYYFISNTDASYSGMAQVYKDVLTLDRETKEGSGLNLTLLGMDYKGGLFGKNYVPMTTYDDVVTIASELKTLGVNGLNIVYTGWNKGGYYDNELMKPVTSSKLGGKRDFLEMMSYLNENSVDIYFQSNPLISYQATLGSGVVKKITLSSFATSATRSSLFAYTYYTNPEEVADKVLKFSRLYENLGIDSLALSTVGSSLFSYRDNQINYYRNQALSIIQGEIEALAAYQMGLYQPNSYLWKSTDTYYQAPVESNKYAYITDSIPFVQLVLNGSSRLVSSYVNYVSDYDLLALRLIEYGMEPSFLITKESTHKLRYTNSQYIYTSQYDLWDDIILDIGMKTQAVLNDIGGQEMISHRYIHQGVSESIYQNGTKVYVNYTNLVQVVDVGIAVAPNTYRVVKP